MYISILGRQPALGIAELERLYDGDNVRQFSSQSALINTPTLNFERLGGSQKAGRVILELPRGDWRQVSMKIVHHYLDAWKNTDRKITLGISAYGFPASARDIQKTGIILKTKLKTQGTSLRLIPNSDAALNTATSHHNKLGLSPNRVELIVVRAHDGRVIVAESIGAQNITAYAKRDQDRPKRDAFVGMLPPKLAQIMVNLAGGASLAAPVEPSTSPLLEGDVPARASQAPQAEQSSPVERPPKKDGDVDGELDRRLTLLDPFCGTGVILQEAALMGYAVYGTDLSPKMIDFSTQNLEWLARTHRTDMESRLETGDAMDHVWRQPINAVACETYLGQPFSAPPSPAKLREVRGNCNHIISTFLKNIGSQLEPGTPLCIGVPAWRDKNGNFSHLPLVDQLEKLGYHRHEFSVVQNADLLYYREDQIVARELLVLTKA